MAKTSKPSLAETHPELATEADGWDPSSTTRGSDKKRNWSCALGHKWSASILSRTTGTGCPICSGRTALKGVNDLATTHPELAAQADGWDPRMFKARSGRKVPWKCGIGHTWSAVIANRSKGIGCPICSAYTVQIGVNDLATTHPELATQADGWDPTITTRAKGGKVGWQCKFEHKWQATVGSRINGTGCPVCSNNLVQPGFNDLATTHPELAAQADGWDPRTLSAGANKKRQWKCELGHKWTAVIYSRTNGNGCPSCARHGFKPSEAAWMYLIENANMRLLQIGITNNPEERLAKHRRSGFEVVLDIRGPLDGYLARDLERACLKAFKKRDAKFARDIDVAKFDGSTESWSTRSLNLKTIPQALEWVYEDEGINDE